MGGAPTGDGFHATAGVELGRVLLEGRTHALRHQAAAERLWSGSLFLHMAYFLLQLGLTGRSDVSTPVLILCASFARSDRGSDSDPA